MWWHLVLIALLTDESEAFAPSLVRWGGLHARRFVLAPIVPLKGYDIVPSVAVPPFDLTVRDQQSLDEMLSSDAPLFTPQSDGTVTWSAMGLCLEASGDSTGDAVRVNRCTGGPKQLWSFSSLGEYTHIQLEGSRKCIAMNGEDGGLSRAKIELQECDERATRSWRLEGPLPYPSKGTPRPLILEHQRVLSLLGVVVLVVAVLRAWLWNRGKKSGMVGVSRVGVSLTGPFGLGEGSVPLKAKLNRVVAPAVMATNPEVVELNEVKVATDLATHFVQKAATGEWAGWQCEFNPTDGSIIPVPDKYCSDAMIEWEQVPFGFELLSTESISGGPLESRVLKVLPADGCSVDDLDCEISKSLLPMPIHGSAASAIFAIDDVEPTEQTFLQTIFATDYQPVGTVRLGKASARGLYRVRVTLRYDSVKQRVTGGPVRIACERKWGDAGEFELQPGFKTRADGVCSGLGLDAAYVSKAVSARCFGEKQKMLDDRFEANADVKQHLRLPVGVTVEVRARAGGVCGAVVKVALDGEAHGASGERRMLREFDESGKLVVAVAEEDKQDSHDRDAKEDGGQ